MKKLTITMAVLDILAIICFILFYAVKDFKYTLIATAMNTKTHQWVAYTFYSEEEVNRVLAADSYIPINEDVKLDDIVIDTKEKDSYDNEYDEQVLTRDGNNEDYKLINIKVGGYNAYLVAIYDPSKVRLVHADKFNVGGNPEKNRLIYMCPANGAKVCINGGMFVDYGTGSDIPMGYLIKDGKVIWSDHNGAGNLIGFNYDGKLMLVTATGEEAIKMGIRDALEFGPFLIVNGKTIQFNGSVGGYSRAARVAIGQRRDGVVLFLVTDGTHAAGPNMGEVTDTLKKYGAYNAANLDGGTSSTLVINGKLINNPKNIYGQRLNLGRKIVSGFGLVP